MDESQPEPPRSAGANRLQRRMAMVMYSIIFLYSAAFWIQTGVMPVRQPASPPHTHSLTISLLQFLSKKLGANPVIFGYMETLFAVSMLLGGPLFGRFGDIFGARAALLVAFLSSFLSYLVLSMASSIPELFLSRVFAFMMHAMHGRDTAVEGGGCPLLAVCLHCVSGCDTLCVQGHRW